MSAAITRIVLQGFKSFNKKISIPLLNGLNIFCGPNGTGKSNIVDAVCFVLGRVSAKSMRANRLHELIFHGSNGKKPAEYASVTLYLDNSNKVFPFDESEVSITRKVNRKGVSIYKINGKVTTREKVLQLLSSARIYPEGHNIVLQGDVTNIIEMSPIERRLIIDEISGIAEYNEKKEKAYRDLALVDQKLKEAEIIITERYDIFKKLEKERNAALRFQELHNQLILLKASLANKKVKTFEENIGRIDLEIKEKEEKIEKLKEEIESIETKLEERERSVRKIVEKLLELSKSIEKEKEVSKLRAELIVKRGKLESNLKEIERLNSLIEKLEAIESKELEGEIPRSVKTILNLNLRGVYGVISQLIKVPENLKVAMEVAAGPHLYDIVVENEEVASYCIDFLKRERVGRATFLPLNKIKPSLFKDVELLSRSGIVGIASRLINFDTKFLAAIEFVFGNTLVVENLEVARSIGIGRTRMVTLEGDLIERSGLMTGGYYIKAHPKVLEISRKEEIDKYIELRKVLEKEVELLGVQVEELEKKLREMEKTEITKEFIDLEKIKIVSEREIESLRERRRKSYERRLALQSEINKLKIQRAKLEAELENARVELQQYKPMQYVDEKISVLEEFIKRTQKEIDSLGPVNFRAIEEFEKFKAEFESYKEKYEKILEEKKAVLKMVEEIEKRRREVFYKCLQEISMHFNNIFAKMTNGTASLSLEDPLNLESGLVIQASPRGKTLLNIDAMSGGEKTLTALAFLFAIQKYKPTPFYILDEVDAALDKENSKIVAELLKKLSRGAQFIVITHNDTTIKYGDRVYGVTLEKGESKILGLEMPHE